MSIKVVRIISVSLLFIVLSAIKAPAVEPNWQWLNPLPQGNTLFGVWGSAGNNVFAVGENGTIVHYDGTGWQVVSTGDFPTLIDIWGSSANDVFAVGKGGTILHYDGIAWSPMNSGTTTTLTAIWGSAPNDVFAVGYVGPILHYDGVSWNQMDIGLNGALDRVIGPLSVWGSSAADVFVGGLQDTAILHYDGATWSLVPTAPYGFPLPFMSITGSTDGHFFATYGNSMAHFDGTQWTDLKLFRLGTREVTGLWANAANDLFVAAAMLSDSNHYEANAILHYDGISWNFQLTGLLETLNDFWGSSGTDVFAVGKGGRIYHYDGIAWTAMSGGFFSNEISRIWGSSPNDLFALDSPVSLGGAIRISHYDGATWTQMSLPGEPSSPPEVPPPFFRPTPSYSLTKIWGSSPTSVFASGKVFFPFASYAVILRYNGVEWTESYRAENNYFPEFKDIWEASENDVYAVGFGGIFHFDGSTWRKLSSTLGLFGSSIWGSSGNDVYAVGGKTIFHFDGITWSIVDPGIELAENLSLIWGRSASDIYVAGYDGTVLHYNGSGWSLVRNPDLVAPDVQNFISPGFEGIWGTETDLLITGLGGLVHRYDGFTWSRIEFGFPGVRGIGGSLGNDIFIGGSSIIYHYDGSTLRSLNVDERFGSFDDFWGSSGTDAYAVSVNGKMLHYDGFDWSEVPLPTPQPAFELPPSPIRTDRRLYDIWGSSSTDVFAVGKSNAGRAEILHFDGSTWSETDAGFSGGFLKVWGVSGTDVYAMGYSAIDEYSHEYVTWHYDGITWSPTGLSFVEIWGPSGDDLFAATSDGTIYRYDGNSWSQWSFLTPFIERIWGSSENDLYAVTSILYHFDGSVWNPMPAPYSSFRVFDIWGSAQNDVFVIGTDHPLNISPPSIYPDNPFNSYSIYKILHYDGYSWTEVAGNLSEIGLWGNPENDIYTFGRNGAIRFYDREANPAAGDPSPWSSNFDGDGISDMGVYLDRTGTWYLNRSSGGYREFQFGFAGTHPVTGDFNGDGAKDFGVYHPPSGMWHMMVSGTGHIVFPFGFAGTIPVAGDFDADGATDYGVYDPPTGMWYLMQTAQGFQQKQWGFSGTYPVTGDFDGDGISDVGVYFDQTGTWYIDRSGSGYSEFQFGFAGTSPVTGDFDGDGATDYGVYDPHTGMWYLIQTSQGFKEKQWGFAGTTAIP